MGLWEEDKNGNLITRDKRDIIRFLNMLEYEGNASIDDIEEFISGEISGEGGKLSDGSALLTGLNVINGRPTDRSILRTHNEISYYFGYTNYIYNDDDYEKRNEIASNPKANWIAEQILRTESAGEWQPLTADNYIRYMGGEETARLSMYSKYSDMMSASVAPIPASFPRYNPKIISRTSSTKINGSRITNTSTRAIETATTMSFREFRAKYSHLYKGKYKGRGTYMKYMAKDWRAGKHK